MLVRQISTNAQTGEVTESWVEMPDVVTAEEQAPIDAANAAAEAAATGNGRTLQDQALAALAANKVFYQRTSSTTAQVLAQVKALSRQNNAVIRLLLKRLDGVD